MASEEDYGSRRRKTAPQEHSGLTIAERKALAVRSSQDPDVQPANWIPDDVDVETESEEPEEVQQADVESSGESPKSKKRIGLIVAGGVVLALIVGGAIIIPKVAHAGVVKEYHRATAELQKLESADAEYRADVRAAETLSALQAPEARDLQGQLLALADNPQVMTEQQAEAVRTAAAKLGEVADSTDPDLVTAVKQEAPTGGWLSVSADSFEAPSSDDQARKAAKKQDRVVTKDDVEQVKDQSEDLRASSKKRPQPESAFAEALDEALDAVTSAARASGSSSVKAALNAKGTNGERVVAISGALSDYAAELQKKADDAKRAAAEQESSSEPVWTDSGVQQTPAEPEYIQREYFIPPEDVPGDHKQWEGGDSKWQPEYHPPAPAPEPEPEPDGSD